MGRNRFCLFDGAAIFEVCSNASVSEHLKGASERHFRASSTGKASVTQIGGFLRHLLLESGRGTSVGNAQNSTNRAFICDRDIQAEDCQDAWNRSKIRRSAFGWDSAKRG
jgi:hypothetical protein